MQGFIRGSVDAGVFLSVAQQTSLNDVGMELLIALGIVVIHIVIEPFIKLIFSWLKDKIKAKQKTPENDGELADKLLDTLDSVEKNTEETLKKIEEGVNDGRNKRTRD